MDPFKKGQAMIKWYGLHRILVLCGTFALIALSPNTTLAGFIFVAGITLYIRYWIIELRRENENQANQGNEVKKGELRDCGPEKDI